MKKAASVFLIIAMIFSLFGCKNGDSGTADETTTLPVNAVMGEGTHTLMVYMVGSDLESKGAAATNDLQEMAESGIDLSKVNLLVYAGGSKKWHNDNVSEDSGQTVLQLTENGFTNIATMASASMGEAESLTEFLNYANTNFPADSFSLIMWNHGNGPLIGYGKDMLFDNDSLTLSEMKTALEASPFNSENKLSWVGFDACLMASAELSIIWKDYAEYLIASQEIEPSFGWDYSFLSALTGDSNTLFNSITETYLTTCEDYYEKKGFDNRDTTLSCMDLSYADELETALNNLFKKAAGDIDSSFNSLSVSRANARALGRASTGSEYDLIDLNDMAQQMSSAYPEETKAIQNILSDMTVSNKTNAENLSGMSVYYPFYNKSYYEKSWGEVYKELGVLSDYANYLSSYTEIWLNDDKLEETAESNEPEQTSDNKFTLELTDEQAENYVSSRYIILSKKGEELYLPIFSSQDTELKENTLIANWESEILYGRDGLGNYIIPATTQHDTVGDITRYSFYVNLTNNDYETEGHRFHIAANTKTKEISTSALVPYNTNVNGSSLMGGKLEDADLSRWSKYIFVNQRHIYVERYDNGAIKPLSEWKETALLSGYSSRIGDGIEFLFAPLVSGEYSLIFEVTDTQGNRYCSDLLEFTANGTLEYPDSEPQVEVSWTEGDSVELFEEQGIKLELTSIDYYGTQKYALRATNNNDFAVIISDGEIGYNQKVYCGTYYAGISLQPGETLTDDYGFSFGDAEDLGFLTSQTPVDTIQFSVSALTLEEDKTLIYKKWVNVAISDETNFMPEPADIDDNIFMRNFYHLPSNDILAPKQELFMRDGLKVTLAGLGGDGSDNSALIAALEIENTSSSTKVFSIQGFIFDDIFIEKDSGPISVPADSIIYKQIYISYDDMQKYYIASPSSVTLCAEFSEFAMIEGGGGFAEWAQYPIKLSQKGTGCSLEMGSKLVYDEHSIKIYQKEIVYADGDYDNYDKIIFTVENNSGYDIKVSPENYYLNSDKINTDSISSSAFSIGTPCPDGTVSVFEIKTQKDYADSITLKTDIYIMDMSAEMILFPDTIKAIEINIK